MLVITILDADRSMLQECKFTVNVHSLSLSLSLFLSASFLSHTHMCTQTMHKYAHKRIYYTQIQEQYQLINL